MIRFLTREAIDIIHAEQIAEHGGLPGLRDDNGLEAALSRPRNKATYGETDIFVLAAAYLFGIARSHPYSDGNKRTSFLALFTFLFINGFLLEAEQAVIVEFVLAVSAGEINEDGIVLFLKDYAKPLS